MNLLLLVLIGTIPASPQRQARASDGALALAWRCGLAEGGFARNDPATKAHPRRIQKVHSTRNEPATKAHRSAASVEDSRGRWATNSDNDDRAGGRGAGERGRK